MGMNGWWQDSHGKGNMKGKLSGLEALYALSMLGTIVLNVVHG